MTYDEKLALWTKECLADAAIDVVAEIRKRLPLGVEFPNEQEARIEVGRFLAEQLTEHKAEYFVLYRTTPQFNRERFRLAFAKLLDEICPREGFSARFEIPGFSPN